MTFRLQLSQTSIACYCRRCNDLRRATAAATAAAGTAGRGQSRQAASSAAGVSQHVLRGPPLAGPAPGIGYAGFWIRFVAVLIDGIIIGVPLAIVFFVAEGSTLPVTRTV